MRGGEAGVPPLEGSEGWRIARLRVLRCWRLGHLPKRENATLDAVTRLNRNKKHPLRICMRAVLSFPKVDQALRSTLASDDLNEQGRAADQQRD